MQVLLVFKTFWPQNGAGRKKERKKAFMSIDAQLLAIGKIVSNLQSLEFLLRGYLVHQPGATPLGMPYGFDWYSSPVGSKLPLNDLTSYETLGQLINRFNATRPAGAPTLGAELVALRDALAHGRVSSEMTNDQLRLIKFTAPKNGFVEVAFNEVMTDAWLSQQVALVCTAIHTVHDALPEHARGPAN